MELHAVDPPTGVLERGDGHSAVRAVTTKPSGRRTIESKWLIHTGCAGWSGSSRTLPAP